MKTIQVRIPITLYNEIKRIQKNKIKESMLYGGKKKPCTFVQAANSYRQNRNSSFFGGQLL